PLFRAAGIGSRSHRLRSPALRSSAPRRPALRSRRRLRPRRRLRLRPRRRIAQLRRRHAGSPIMIRSARAFLLIASVLASYGVQWLLVNWLPSKRWRARLDPRWALVHERNAARLERGFTELRGVFIKLGQVISVLGGFLPDQYRRALEKLQDQVPPRPFEEVIGRLEEAFGPRALQRYASFDRAPLAAASLAQVHK